MSRRWTPTTAILSIWYILLSGCAGYGLFWLVHSLGVDVDLSGVAGSIGFACCVVVFDQHLPRAE